VSQGAARLHRMRTDAALVRRFRAGDEAAFSTLHARYADGIRNYAAYMLRGTVHDADDAAQDVFLRAYQSLRRDEREIDVRPWLFRVAHNRCIDALRRPVSDALEEDGAATAGGDLAEDIERREAMRALLRDIGALTDGQRSALLLRELGGLSHEAVGEALGITPTSSRMLVHRARTALTDAAEARDTTCGDVRARLVAATDLGTRLARRDQRHLVACAECRAFRRAHTGVTRELSLLAPAGLGLGGVLRLFGGGGAAATAGSTSLVSGTATKLTVGACCALLAGGGAAVGVREATDHHPAPATKTATHRRAAARGDQQSQSLIAIGGGQVTKRATTTRSTFTPEHHTDVIVAVKPRTVSDRPTAKPPAHEDPATSLDLADLDHAPRPAPARTTPAAATPPDHTTTLDLADLEGG
jgi:RNA polymerase sigma factor (sigma-70 family)